MTSTPRRRFPLIAIAGMGPKGLSPVPIGRNTPSGDGWMARERPQGGAGAGVQTHLRPNPYQALGLGGRSRPGQCCPCGADRPGHEGARRVGVVA